MKIGIITAMPEEFRAVADSLGAVSPLSLGTLRAASCTAFGHEFLLVESGMGLDNAAGAAEMAVNNAHLDLLVSTGFCGAVQAGLQAGDIVVAKQVVISHESGFEEIPVPLSASGQTFVAREAAMGERVVGGVFVTTPEIVSKSSLNTKMPGHYHHPVVEMESGAIAIVAVERSIPLLAIRAVSDDAAEEFGFTLDEFCDGALCRIRPSKVLFTILKKPWIVPQLVRLGFSSRTAARSLTAALSRLFPVLEHASRR
jgi:adenosylhomocysteine nucleosidase